MVSVVLITCSSFVDMIYSIWYLPLQEIPSNEAVLQEIIYKITESNLHSNIKSSVVWLVKASYECYRISTKMVPEFITSGETKRFNYIHNCKDWEITFLSQQISSLRPADHMCKYIASIIGRIYFHS
jgi:hypothetical protein